MSASNIDKCCQRFGFPFSIIRSCRAKDCKCMEFQLDGSSSICKVAGCGHARSEHLKVERKFVTKRSRLHDSVCKGYILIEFFY